MSSSNFEQYMTSQPSSSQHDHMEVDCNTPGSGQFSSGRLTPTCSAPTLCSDQTDNSEASILTVEDVLLDYGPLSSESVFNTMEFSPLGDTPDDPIDVDEAAFRHFHEEFDLDEWRRQNSWAEFLENHDATQPEAASSSSSSTGPPPIIYPRRVYTLPDKTHQMNKMLEVAWLSRPGPQPEPSIFRNLEPYDTYGLPPECFILKKTDKDQKMDEDKDKSAED